MNEVRTLLENYWIRKDSDKEWYLKIKRAYPQYKRFVTENLGWRIIVNERILKLEKIPAYAEAFMGISTFSDIRDYCILCAILAFLEDKEDHEQFLLSELVDMIEIQLKEYMEIDWTKFVQRKSLVRALQYAEQKGMILVYEGSSDRLSSSLSNEILYENTGLSRYFATNFNYDISEFSSYKDFEAEKLQDLDMDRGHFRINRVYRQLVSAPAMYWREPDDPDYLYVKNQRQWVQKYMDENLGGNLQIHKNGAFFVMENDNSFGERHPKEAMLPEVVLLISTEVRRKVNQGTLLRGNDDLVQMDKDSFTALIYECKEKYGSTWSKEYREMEIEQTEEEVLAYMESWMLLRTIGDELLLYPAVGKFIGVYPKDFAVKGKEEHE